MLVNSRSILLIFFQVFYIDDQTICKQRQFHVLIPRLYSFTYRDFCTVLERNGRRGRPCLVLDLSAKAPSFSPGGGTWAVGFVQVVFIKLMGFPSISTLLRVVWKSKVSVKSCQMLFLHLLLWTCEISFLVYRWDGFHWFLVVGPGLHNQDTSCLILVYVLFCGVWGFNLWYFVQEFLSRFGRGICSFLIIPLSGFSVRVVLAS